MWGSHGPSGSSQVLCVLAQHCCRSYSDPDSRGDGGLDHEHLLGHGHGHPCNLWRLPRSGCPSAVVRWSSQYRECIVSNIQPATSGASGWAAKWTEAPLVRRGGGGAEVEAWYEGSLAGEGFASAGPCVVYPATTPKHLWDWAELSVLCDRECVCKLAMWLTVTPVEEYVCWNTQTILYIVPTVCTVLKTFIFRQSHPELLNFVLLYRYVFSILSIFVFLFDKWDVSCFWFWFSFIVL